MPFLEEVHSALCEMNGDKDPGLEGFVHNIFLAILLRYS